mmetsp:Transcript_26638/g.63359  ORF Transcript_26638/g.63359 Transcript_26638/m.63359 type:complete len:82 (-) Transcript_26638:96-341(-)
MLAAHGRHIAKSLSTTVLAQTYISLLQGLMRRAHAPPGLNSTNASDTASPTSRVASPRRSSESHHLSAVSTNINTKSNLDT